MLTGRAHRMVLRFPKTHFPLLPLVVVVPKSEFIEAAEVSFFRTNPVHALVKCRSVVYSGALKNADIIYVKNFGQQVPFFWKVMCESSKRDAADLVVRVCGF